MGNKQLELQVLGGSMYGRGLPVRTSFRKNGTVIGEPVFIYRIKVQIFVSLQKFLNLKRIII